MSFTEQLRLTAAAAAVVLTGCATGALAQEAAPADAEAHDTGWPFVPGDFWEVSAIDIKPGGGLTYARHLADRWRASQDFAVSKGWIKDYMVLSNYHARDGEPDLYLISVMESLPTGAESEAQFAEFRAWADASAEQLVAASGDRAEVRRLMGDSLLQEMQFRE